MAVTRLSGGLTPANGSDPRTFPAIWNATAEDIEQAELDIVGLKDGSLLPDATPLVAGIVRGSTTTSNTALGADALQSNTTGSDNTAVGREALELNSTGSNNVAVGTQALENNTASSNVSVGFRAAQVNTTGSQNTTIGFEAMQNNSTGASNVAVGFRALELGTAGDNNVAIGQEALQNDTVGDTVAVGYRALRANTTGTGNTAVGNLAGSTLTTGTNNTLIGQSAAPSAVTVSNQITLGNSSISALRCQVTTISALSDQRDKTDIVDTGYGLDLINKLRPVEFTWDTRDGAVTNKPDLGFIAQELAAVEDEYDDAERLRFTLRDNPEKLEATPGRLLPILVKAVQELSAKNAELEARLEKLENK
jgi:hypothetical protein